MIREIKFRGKFSKDKEWKYGFLSRGKDYHTNKSYFTIKHSDIESTQVDKESIGQYTGLKDKNGKEIYEGDIIQIYRYDDIIHKDKKVHTSEIRFFFGMFAWFSPLTQDWHSLYNLARPGEPIEVIGNIYENPELLK